MVSHLLKHWKYHSLALSHQYVASIVQQGCVLCPIIWVVLLPQEAIAMMYTGNTVEPIHLESYLLGTRKTYTGTPGHISQTIFHRNSNSMEISFCFHPNFNEVIAMEFFTSHKNSIAMACARFCSDMIPWHGVTWKPIFHWIMMEKLFLKWSPGQKTVWNLLRILGYFFIWHMI